MKEFANGTRFMNYGLYETRLHSPYDYARDGLLKHLMSRRIIDSKNKVLQYMLQVTEKSMVYLMKSVDMMENFFNYNWKNR